MVDSLHLVGDRMQVVNHLQRVQKTQLVQRKNAEGKNCRSNKRKKRRERKKSRNSRRQKRREREKERASETEKKNKNK